MAKGDTHSRNPLKGKHSANKQSRKSRYFQNTFEKGGYVHLIENGKDFFGQIAIVKKDGLFLDVPDDPEDYYFYENNFVIRNVKPVSDLHIEILKRYRDTLNPVRKFMIESPKLSVRIIKENGFDPRDLEQMKGAVVPELLSDTQWIHWKRRVEKLLRIPQTPSDQHHSPTTGNSDFLIKPQDFIVRVQTFNCSNKNHTLLPIQAELLTRSFDGKSLSSILIPAGYCKECKHFYILSSIFMQKSLFMKGALCDVVFEKDLHTYLLTRRIDSGKLAQESIMKKCGYTVSNMTGLNDQERSNLLGQIIKHGILSQKEVESFLNWLIHLNSTNPLQTEAVAKWRDDLESISKKAKGTIVPIHRIILN